MAKPVRSNEKAAAAIAHLLTRILYDPRLAYYFDPIGASMEELSAAHAECIGMNVEDFRRDYYKKLKYERPLCAECKDEVR